MGLRLAVLLAAGTPLLTDSKPCVQAIDKLCRGEFSASPRVTSFLTTVSRYQVSLQHLAGKANLPSDFTSRNAPDCNEPNCQICTFVHDMGDSVVRGVSIQYILDNKSSLPFPTRSAWLQIQRDCPDLRRVHDGVLVVKRSQPFVPAIETIVVPRSVLDGLLTPAPFTSNLTILPAISFKWCFNVSSLLWT